MPDELSIEDAIEVLENDIEICTIRQKQACDLAIKALEKDIAKEPKQTHKRYGHGNEYDDYYCPECDGFLAYEPQGNGFKQEGGWSRCRNCGQKIKWEVKNERKTESKEAEERA